MANLHFELVSPERVLFSGEVDSVVIPATEGEMTVLSGHAPTMTALNTGFIVMTINGKRVRVLIRGGFADANAKGLTVLAERAFNEDELNQEVFAKEIAAAEQELGHASDDMKHVAELALSQLIEIRAKYN